jgi:sugar lactone lactonase YvrE/enterochelin esterase-like enzyme
MNRILLLPWLAAAVCMLLPTARAADDYQPGPDSLPQEGVPRGEVLQFKFDQSKIFPGTTRDYWVYIPVQYQPDTPACVYVAQDGVQHNAPVVFDNLIHKKEMPITIGVFVRPGVVKALSPDHGLDRFNRSFEYDGLGDAYVRFLVEELLPDVEKQKASDGRAVRLSRSGNDRAIGGQSSGGICAFTAAWERPNEFSRVFSSIGTFVDLRGGMRYPSLIRKYEPKPIRVFLQDGSADNNRYGGDWWMANQTMERALTFAGYEVEHAWGDGGHTSKHGTAIFPDAMRFLWKDWPMPVGNAQLGNNTLNDLLMAGEGWQLVGEGYRFTEGPAVNSNGEVFFTDGPNSKTYKVGLDGKVSIFIDDTKRAGGQHFGPDGRLYTVGGPEEKVLAWDNEGKSTVIAEGIAGNDLVVASNGNIYVTHPPPGNANAPSKVWLIKPDGTKQEVDTGLRYANGVTLSPDQSLLYVADHRSHWVYSYVIAPDGTLMHKQRYYWLHIPDTSDSANTDGIRCDRAGRLYVATNLGVQVCDQAGRVNCILPTPNRRLSNLCFGGENFDTLFATCGDKVYKRKLKVKGSNAWAAPMKPAAPRL